MAVGIALPSSSRDYNGRLTLFVGLSCLMAAMGGVIFGYDIGISGYLTTLIISVSICQMARERKKNMTKNAIRYLALVYVLLNFAILIELVDLCEGGVTSMEPFLVKFFPEVYTRMKEDTSISNYCKFDSQLLTLFTSSLYLAGLMASFVASYVTRAFGRKPSVLAGGAAFLAGAALGGAAFNVYMLIFGRVLLGVGVGFSNQAVPVYLSEMAPSRYRGAMTNSFQLCVGIGVLAANLINYGTQKIKEGYGWRISIAMAALPASVLTLGAIFLPETPNSIIQRSNDSEKAKQMLQKIRGVEDVQMELNDLINANDISKMVISPFKNIMQRNYRPQLVMSVCIPFFQQVTGINVISFYAPILFRTIGLGESASLLSAVVTGSVGIVTTFISMLIVDKVGRRALLIGGGIQMFVSQTLVGCIMAAKLGDQGKLNNGYAFVILSLICIYVAGFGISWGPLGWLIPSEIFPLEIRSAGQSVNVAVNFLFTFIIGQTFLVMLCHLKFGLFFFFGGWVVVMTGFVFLLLPETKGVPIEQMDNVWKEHWFWSKIVDKELKGKMEVE